MPDNLRVGFWNIHGYRSSILGNKLDEPEFSDILCNHDIFGLVETHAEVQSELEKTNFKCYKKCRQKSGSKQHGGIAVYFRNDLNEGVSYIPTSNDNAIWCKLDKRFFHTEKDIYLATVYLSPNQYEKKTQSNYIDQLENEVLNFSRCGDIVLQGDLNARSGTLQDKLLFEENELFATDGDARLNIPDRNSEDSVSDRRGKDLIESCISNELTILNGRTIGDRKGQKTCFTYNGSSLVDYVICSNEIFNNVSYLKVADLVPYLSDHRHISYGLKTLFSPTNNQNQETNTKINYKKVKTVWQNDTDKDILQILHSEKLSTELTRFCENDLEQNTVDDCIIGLNNIINDTLNSANLLKPLRADKFKETSNAKEKWFDKDCSAEKENLKYIGRLVSRNPHDNALRRLLNENKRIYRRLLRRKKRTYASVQINSLKHLSYQNPKKFWKRLKDIFGEKKSNGKNDSVTTQEFYKHFRNLNKGEANTFTGESDQNEFAHATSRQQGPLDFPLTYEEVDKAIKKLKRNKAPGPDNILNEFLKASKEIMLPVFVKLFNKILDKGEFPVAWATGFIAPIFKKGDKGNSENYRGITLLSCLGKLFTSILNNRLLKFCESNNILQPEQGGFRKDFRTSDNIFILKALIDKYVKNKPKRRNNFLFSCFVDFKKAFDKINRKTLFDKLKSLGINGNFLSVIKTMYSKDKSCVKNGNELSEFFTCSVGVKQGCILSPTLFNIYLHDLPSILSTTEKDATAKIEDKAVNCLLYADDLILFSTSEQGLQLRLNKLQKYCLENDLEISKEKTKAMIFNQNGRKLTRFRPYLPNHNIDIVTSYKYLGITISANGKFNVAKQEIRKAALRALYSLKKNLGVNFSLNIEVTTLLFESLVKPILLYGSEIWGLEGKFNEMRDPIEQVHVKFCKMLLGVSKRAVNKACRAELGRLPLQTEITYNTMKYWSRLIKLDESRLIKLAYNEMTKNNSDSWSSKVEHALYHTGFGWVWEEQDGLDSEQLKAIMLKVLRRIKDIEIQEFFASLFNDQRENANCKNKLRSYRQFKTTYCCENYLTTVKNTEHRRALTKLRISDHELEIERGRYKRPYIQADRRYCHFCPEKVEDEKHFLTNCKSYQHLKSALLQKLNKNSLSFMALINPSNSTANMISRYIFDCFKERKSRLSNIV